MIDAGLRPPPARLAVATALAASLAVAGVGVWKGTRAVGGSDSSCYGLMAQAFARGALQPVSDLAHDAPWSDAARSLAPAGFIPSPVVPGAASPVCAAGFSFLLAAFAWAGGRDAMFLVTPLAGSLLTWLSFVFGRQMAGPSAGAAAAVLTATTPILLFQVVQPMNDVAVAAAWMAVLVTASARRVRPLPLGALAGVAVLLRPTLAPAGAVVALWLAVTGRRAGADPDGGRPVSALSGMARRWAAFAAGSVPFLLVLGGLNQRLYGHALASGYGNLRDLFSIAHVPANVGHYGSAIVETELGLPLLGIAAVVLIPRSRRAPLWLTLACCAATSGVYLLYRPFDEWWYLRFLLPALAPLTVMGASVLVLSTDCVLAGPRARRAALATIVVLAASWGLRTAVNRQAFNLAGFERRFLASAEVARSRLPGHAVFVTVWHSGTMRFHAGRPAVLWDALAPDALDPAVAWLAGRGLEPYLVIEDWEEPTFRARFAGHSAFAGLDWPPRFEIERRVRIYRPSDRANYLSGGAVPSERVITRF